MMENQGNMLKIRCRQLAKNPRMLSRSDLRASADERVDATSYVDCGVRRSEYPSDSVFINTIP